MLFRKMKKGHKHTHTLSLSNKEKLIEIVGRKLGLEGKN